MQYITCLLTPLWRGERQKSSLGQKWPSYHNTLVDLIFVKKVNLPCQDPFFWVGGWWCCLAKLNKNPGPFKRLIFFKLIKCCPMHPSHQNIFMCLFPLCLRRSGHMSFTPWTEKKHGWQSFFGLKNPFSVLRIKFFPINSANKSLFAGLILRMNHNLWIESGK